MMKCKYCKHTIEDDSIFCRFCGERVIRAARKPKDEVSVPKPVRTPGGRYRGRIMVAGERVYVTETSEASYYARARALKAGLIEAAANKPKDVLGDLIDRYIEDHAAVLSPSTVKNYRAMRAHRFTVCMCAPVGAINFQRIISDESRTVSAKTVANAWRLVTAALRYAKLPVPSVTLPKRIPKEIPFLDFEQVTAFVGAIRGHRNEFPFLMGLHSLRYSEIAALTPQRVSGGFIQVSGARVPSEDGYVTKDLTKSDAGRRNVPILIERVNELLPVTELPIRTTDAVLNRQLKDVCSAAGLPPISMHGLRHSFASLAYHLRWTEKATMQLGGWSTPDIVHRVYTHLAQQDIADDVARMRKFYKGEPLLVEVPAAE